MEERENPYAPPRIETSENAEGAERTQEAAGDRPIAVAEGKLSRSEYLEACRLADRTPWWVAAAFVFVSLAAVLYVFLAIDGGRLSWRTLGACALFGYAVVAAYALRPAFRRRAWRRAASLREPVRREFSRSGLRAIGRDFQQQLRWSEFRGYRCSQGLVLLFLNRAPRMFLILPRSNFTGEEDWNRFVQLVEETLPER